MSLSSWILRFFGHGLFCGLPNACWTRSYDQEQLPTAKFTVLLCLQRWRKTGHKCWLRIILLSGRKKAEYLDGGKFGVYLHSGCFCLFKLQIQARDQNPEYDDYDYMESNLHNIVKDNNPQYVTNWKEHIVELLKEFNGKSLLASWKIFRCRLVQRTIYPLSWFAILLMMLVSLTFVQKGG